MVDLLFAIHILRVGVISARSRYLCAGAGGKIYHDALARMDRRVIAQVVPFSRFAQADMITLGYLTERVSVLDSIYNFCLPLGRAVFLNLDLGGKLRRFPVLRFTGSRGYLAGILYGDKKDGAFPDLMGVLDIVDPLKL